MLSSKHQLIGFTLTLITVSEITLAFLISIILLIIMIFNLCCNRNKRDEKTILILGINIYSTCLVYMLVFYVFIVQSTIGDLYRIEFNSPFCILMGYIYSSVLCLLYISFINQAFFRLCRIVYPQYKFLQAVWLYLILIPIEAILAFILLCPIYIWDDIIYLPDDHFCYVPISNIRGFSWIFFSVYGIPLLSLSLIYLRITMYIRKQSNLPIRIQRRQKRDLNAIRGIFTIVGLLLLLGLPTTILIIMMFITGEAHPLTFRITCASIGTSMLGLSITMISFAPQLKNIVFRTLQLK